MKLKELQASWVDTPEYHQSVHDSFIENVNNDESLKAHRDFVENNIWGFGERSFHWLWKLICDELPKNAALLEIGVFKAQTLSLWRMLMPDATIFGVTPMDTSGDVWESDYKSDIKHIHELFGLKQPNIYHGRSDDQKIISKASKVLYDVVYVDGSHTYEDALFDLKTYSQFIKSGGYLVIDDCNNEMSLKWGAFQGIDTVTQAKLDFLKDNNEFEFVCSVVHISVFKRK